MRAFIRQERGVALVEFALVAPLLALLLGGLFDVGNIVHTRMVVTDAAREGSFAASLGDANAAQEVITYLNDALGSRTDVLIPTVSAVSITCGVPPGSACALPVTPGTAITVSVPVTANITTPIIQNLLGGMTFTVTGSATMEASQ